MMLFTKVSDESADKAESFMQEVWEKFAGKQIIIEITEIKTEEDKHV